MSLDVSWRDGLGNLLNPRLTDADILDKSEAHQQEAAVRKLVNLVDFNAKTQERWAALEPRVDSAVNRALERMSEPGPNQLSPNKKDALETRYRAAKAATAQPSASDLLHNNVREERFDLLQQYLEELYRSLGDYSENPI